MDGNRDERPAWFVCFVYGSIANITTLSTATELPIKSNLKKSIKVSFVAKDFWSMSYILNGPFMEKLCNRHIIMLFYAYVSDLHMSSWFSLQYHNDK